VGNDYQVFVTEAELQAALGQEGADRILSAY
jgi:hypothetical protein